MSDVVTEGAPAEPVTPPPEQAPRRKQQSKKGNGKPVSTLGPSGAEEAQRRPWPADAVERWPLEKIKEYDKNARIHSDEQVAQIAASMRRFGVTTPVLVDEDGVLIYGHGRRRAAALLGLKELPVSVARGWTELEKRGYRIADNQLTLIGEWDIPILKAEISDLSSSGFDMPLLGFPDLQLVEFTSGINAGSFGEAEAAEKSKLLNVVSVTIAEPTTRVEIGDHYILENRHHLLCMSVITDWPRWVLLLKEGTLFCPYPGVFIPFSVRAQKHDLVMIQPDPYIAGHILDRFIEVRGPEGVSKEASL